MESRVQEPDKSASTIELGVVICKACGGIMHTLPTNGVKKIFGQCDRPACRERDNGGNRS